MLLHEFPACDKSGIFLVKLFLDNIRKIIKKSLVHNNCRFYLSVMCKETKEEVWSKPIEEV